VKQDGETKNDAERNTTKRLLARIKQQHPKLKLIVTEGGLFSNAPHINDLRSYGYIIFWVPSQTLIHICSKRSLMLATKANSTV